MQKSTKPTPRRGKPTAPRARKESKVKVQITPEYKEYLNRYAEFGEGRLRLSPEEFDRLDDELLELLDLSGHELSDDQIVRIQELEYLLIDTE